VDGQGSDGKEQRGRGVATTERDDVVTTPPGPVDPSNRPARASLGWLALWIGVPAACATWVAVNSTDYYPLFDEWVMVDRAADESVLRGLLLGFNGHMWSLASAAYSFQFHFLDLQANWLVPLLLVASLVALQLAVAAVLVRLGLPAVVALAAATVVAYFGPASETMVYQHLFGYNFALALSFAAAYVALGDTRDRRRAIVVALLLLAALPCDSALAVGGLLFTGVLVLFAWPFRLGLVALGPPVAAHLGWLMLDRSEVLVRGACQNCRSVQFSAPLGDSVDFAWAVLTRSAGGLVTGSVGAGIGVLVVASGATIVGLLRRRLTPRVIGAVVGGALATLLTVGLFAWTRAGFWGSVEDGIATLDGVSNRYLQPAAIFLLIGFLPAIWATFVPTSRAAARVLGAAVAAALVVVFVVNLGSLWPTRDFYRGWSAQVKGELQQAVAVVAEGCGPGEVLDRDAEPVAASFQIKVSLIEEMLARGALDASFGRTPTPEVRDAICATR
jgi:hypothetical protein